MRHSWQADAIVYVHGDGLYGKGSRHVPQGNRHVCCMKDEGEMRLILVFSLALSGCLADPTEVAASSRAQQRHG